MSVVPIHVWPIHGIANTARPSTADSRKIAWLVNDSHAMWTPLVVRRRGSGVDSSPRGDAVEPRAAGVDDDASAQLALGPAVQHRLHADAGQPPVLVNRADDFGVVPDERAVLRRVDGVLDRKALRRGALAVVEQRGAVEPRAVEGGLDARRSSSGLRMRCRGSVLS